MDLTNILTISGKPGLYKLLSQSKIGAVVESLVDGKRLSAFATEKISSLEEISIFGTDEDIPLKDVFRSIHTKESGKEVLSGAKLDDKVLKSYFIEVLPSYDKERVYASDIKKVISWYNLLIKNDLLKLEDTSSTESVAETEKGGE